MPETSHEKFKKNAESEVAKVNKQIKRLQDMDKADGGEAVYTLEGIIPIDFLT